MFEPTCKSKSFLLVGIFCVVSEEHVPQSLDKINAVKNPRPNGARNRYSAAV